jgi:hypothetical protein
MIAIETKYYGATNTRGSKIIASTANGQRLSFPYDHEGNEHERAADALARKMGWLDNGKFRLVGGGTKSGMAFVFVEV